MEQISFDLAPPLVRRERSISARSRLCSTSTRMRRAVKNRPRPSTVTTSWWGPPGIAARTRLWSAVGPFEGPRVLADVGAGGGRTSRCRPTPAQKRPVRSWSAPHPGRAASGPAYEFVFELDHLLRRRGPRHRVPITFVTPEPFLGHMGNGGAGTIRRLLEGCPRRARHHLPDLRPRSPASPTTRSKLVRRQSDPLSTLSMVMPPPVGVAAVAARRGTRQPEGVHPGRFPLPAPRRGWPLRGRCRRRDGTSRRDAGAGQLPQDWAHTQMATIAAADITARLAGRDGAHRGAGRPLRDGHGRPRRLYVRASGPPAARHDPQGSRRAAAGCYAKCAFEKAYLTSARHDVAILRRSAGETSE